MGKGYKLCSGGGSISSSASYDTKNNIPHNADMLGRKYTAEDIDKLNQNLEKLGGFEPVIDDSTGKITGYKTTIGGADTVFPFSSSGELYYLGSKSSIDISNIQGYEDFTSDNFIVIPDSGSVTASNNNAATSNYLYSVSGNISISKSYNSSKGILAVSCSENFSVTCVGASNNFWTNKSESRGFKVYLYTGTVKSI